MTRSVEMPRGKAKPNGRMRNIRKRPEVHPSSASFQPEHSSTQNIDRPKSPIKTPQHCLDRMRNCYRQVSPGVHTFDQMRNTDSRRENDNINNDRPGSDGQESCYIDIQQQRNSRQGNNKKLKNRKETGNININNDNEKVVNNPKDIYVNANADNQRLPKENDNINGLLKTKKQKRASGIFEHESVFHRNRQYDSTVAVSTNYPLLGSYVSDSTFGASYTEVTDNDEDEEEKNGTCIFAWDKHGNELWVPKGMIDELGPSATVETTINTSKSRRCLDGHRNYYGFSMLFLQILVNLGGIAGIVLVYFLIVM